MEIMEHIVNSLFKIIALILMVVAITFDSNCQIKGKVISHAFSYQGNAKFGLSSDSANKLLVHDLTKNIYFSAKKPSCQYEVGIFMFKINSNGKIDNSSIECIGNLLDTTRNDILMNIKSASGKFVKGAKNGKVKNCWYVFEYFSLGYDKNCGDLMNAIDWERSKQSMFYSYAFRHLFKNISDRKKKLIFISGSSNREAERRGLIRYE
jgi:hypothetical protein